MTDRSVTLLEALPLVVIGGGDSQLVSQAEFLAQFSRALTEEPEKSLSTFVNLVRRGLASEFLDLAERLEAVELLGRDTLEALVLFRELYQELARDQRAWTEKLLDALVVQGVPAALLKSYDIEDRFGSPVNLPLAYDVDLMVHGDDYPVVREAARALGLEQAELQGGELKRTQRAQNWVGAYEWWPFMARGPRRMVSGGTLELARAAWPMIPGEIVDSEIQTVVAIDVHFGIDPDIPAHLMWERVERYGPRQRLAFSATALAWFLSGRVYQETMQHGGQKFRLLARLHRVLGSGRVDWADLGELADNHNMQPAVYYSVRSALCVKPFDLPASFLPRLKSSFGGEGHSSDLGELWPVLLRLDRDESLVVEQA